MFDKKPAVGQDVLFLVDVTTSAHVLVKAPLTYVT
jgi:hypothetical protein